MASETVVENFQFLAGSHSKHLHCKMCSELMLEPIRLHRCGHTFCHACANRQSLKKCPLCLQSIKVKQKDILASRLVGELAVRCLHTGCPWKGTLMEYRSFHQEGCKLKEGGMEEWLRKLQASINVSRNANQQQKIQNKEQIPEQDQIGSSQSQGKNTRDRQPNHKQEPNNGRNQQNDKDNDKNDDKNDDKDNDKNDDKDDKGEQILWQQSQTAKDKRRKGKKQLSKTSTRNSNCSESSKSNNKRGPKKQKKSRKDQENGHELNLDGDLKNRVQGKKMAKNSQEFPEDE